MIFPYYAAGDMVKYHMIRLGTENSLGIGSMVVGGAEQHWINNHVRQWQGCVVWAPTKHAFISIVQVLTSVDYV